MPSVPIASASRTRSAVNALERARIDVPGGRAVTRGIADAGFDVTFNKRFSSAAVPHASAWLRPFRGVGAQKAGPAGPAYVARDRAGATSWLARTSRPHGPNSPGGRGTP